MPLALSSWCFHELFYEGKLSLLDMPAYAAQLGFTQVELNDFMLPAPRWSRLRRPLLKIFNASAPQEMWRYTDDNLHRVRSALDNAKVSCLSWTLDTDFTVSDAAWGAQLKYIGWGVKAASLLKAKIIRITLGGEAHSTHHSEYLIIKRLKTIASLHPQITFVVENHWGLSTDIDLFLKIMAEVRAPNCGVCFDPANMPQEDRQRYWEGLARQAVHFHFKTLSFNGRGDEATLDYEHLFSLMNQVGYKGAMVLEFEGKGDAQIGIKKSFKLFTDITQS